MSFNLLTLLDDITSTMDDVAVMTKLAMKKTSGLITDDLAVNVGQVDGVHPKEELPIVFKIFLGSLVNKAIIIPFVLLLTFYSPIILKYILLLGGVYLSYEGAHKVYEKFFVKNKIKEVEKSPDVNGKIWGAIKTDFVLSIEIMVIAQSSIKGDVLGQSITLSVIGLGVSLLIYGLVAILVKIDDVGLHLSVNGWERLGLFLIDLMPKVMRTLSVVGVIAMFIVGGGIFTHHFHFSLIPIEIIQNILIGICVGFFTLTLFLIPKKLKALMNK
jgi:predicted DNA repair protein MutK